MGQIYQAINTSKTVDDFNIKNFVETGTGFCDTVYHMFSLGKDLNIQSVEAYKQVYDDAVKKVGNITSIKIHHGYSHQVLPDLVKELDDNPTMFFHDAHFPGADFKYESYDSEKDDIKRIPLEEELRIVVKNRDVSKDIFVIDDLRVYEKGDFSGGNWEYKDIAGGNGIDFVYELFDETHVIIKSYLHQGFVIMFPIRTKLNLKNYVVQD